MGPRRRVAEPRERPAEERYVVGQVLSSLCPCAAPAAPLARLFSAATAPPVLVAVTGVSAAP